MRKPIGITVPYREVGYKDPVKVLEAKVKELEERIKKLEQHHAQKK